MSNKWKEQGEIERNKPKFLGKGTKFTVPPEQPDDLPVMETVEGSWGKDRNVYVIWTSEFGRVYVSVPQFCKIVETLNFYEYKKPVVIEF
jgi:hypothetical protein